MKYIKKYESLDYEIKIFKINEAGDFIYYDFLEKNPKYDIKDKIKYFDYDDLYSHYYTSKTMEDSLRLIIAYNQTDILGVCKFAYWDNSKSYSMAYLSTNKNYFGQGISKRLLETLFDYFSKNYPNETLCITGYSIEGWKFLHKNVLEFSRKYNVKVKEKAIEFFNNNMSEEERELYDKSKEEIKSLYGEDYYRQLYGY